MFIINGVQVCAVSLSRTVARRCRAIIEVKAQALSAGGASLKWSESEIAEVNQFWIGDLRFGIEESMLEAGAAVDIRFLICDVVETRDHKPQ